jgi:hypothetical protein
MKGTIMELSAVTLQSGPKPTIRVEGFDSAQLWAFVKIATFGMEPTKADEAWKADEVA